MDSYNFYDNIFHVTCINTFKYSPKSSLSKSVAQNEAVIQNGLDAVVLPFKCEFLKGTLTTRCINYLLVVRLLN